jgi:hypothetical protein
MGPGAMICVPSFIQTGSGIQKQIGGGARIHRHTDILTHRQHGDCISLLSGFQNKESGLETNENISFVHCFKIVNLQLMFIYCKQKDTAGRR